MSDNFNAWLARLFIRLVGLRTMTVECRRAGAVVRARASVAVAVISDDDEDESQAVVVARRGGKAEPLGSAFMPAECARES